MMDNRLRYGQPFLLLMRDRANGLVLYGGLGSLGMGEMWCSPSESDMAHPDWDSLLDINDLRPVGEGGEL